MRQSRARRRDSRSRGIPALRPAAAAAIVAGLLAAGCGGSVDIPGTGSGTTPPATTAPSVPGVPGGTTLPGTPTGPDTATPGTAVAACDLLTPDEIQAAIGNPVNAGIATVESVCTWPAAPQRISVNLAVVEVPDEATCALARPEGAQDVTGVDAEAWWEFVQAEVGVGNVVACPRGHQIVLTVTGSADESQMRPGAERLIATVLERL